MSGPSTPEQRRTSGDDAASPALGTAPTIRSKESQAFSQAGTLVLNSGIPAFEENSIYIPTGAENELTYTTVKPGGVQQRQVLKTRRQSSTASSVYSDRS